MSIVYLNGAYLPLADARVSVMDRGFLFGDGVYEVIPVYSGRLFRLSHHLQRLDDSLGGIRMTNPLSHGDWKEMLEKLVEQEPGSNQSVYLQVTRGAAEKRDHAIPKSITPTVFAMTSPMTDPDPKLAQEGVAAFTLDDLRWKLCDIKAITLLANVLLRQEAGDRGGKEAILIRDGVAMEGAASNLFIVKNGIITTPPKSRFLLPGITRDLVLELAEEKGLPFREAEITEHALRTADEVWLTSSTKEIMPVTRLDNQVIGNGRPGPLFRKVSELYAANKQKLKAAVE